MKQEAIQTCLVGPNLFTKRKRSATYNRSRMGNWTKSEKISTVFTPKPGVKNPDLNEFKF